MSQRTMFGVYLTPSQKDKLMIASKMRNLCGSAYLAKLIDDQFSIVFGPGAQIEDVEALLPKKSRLRRSDGKTVKSKTRSQENDNNND